MFSEEVLRNQLVNEETVEAIIRKRSLDGEWLAWLGFALLICVSQLLNLVVRSSIRLRTMRMGRSSGKQRIEVGSYMLRR